MSYFIFDSGGCLDVNSNAVFVCINKLQNALACHYLRISNQKKKRRPSLRASKAKASLERGKKEKCKAEKIYM